jgi:organic radical activating enzyme
MRIKGLKDEDFVNYKKPSMFISTAICDWKCCTEQKLDKSLCQNSELAKAATLDYSMKKIYERYIANPITSAVVIGGLEPFLQLSEVYELIKLFRESGCNDDIVIYTGYYPNEIKKEIARLQDLPNIIIKHGRYIPNSTEHFDNVLGIKLVSDNQYAERIS